MIKMIEPLIQDLKKRIKKSNNQECTGCSHCAFRVTSEEVLALIEKIESLQDTGTSPKTQTQHKLFGGKK